MVRVVQQPAVTSSEHHATVASLFDFCLFLRKHWCVAVPCHRRAAAVAGSDEAAEQLLEMDADGDGWVATAAASNRTDPDAAIPDLDDGNQHVATQSGQDAADDVPDIDDQDDEVGQTCSC